MNRGPYQSYSRDFKVAILSKGGTRSDIRVPRSTKHYWKHKGVGRLPLFGQGMSSTDTEHAIQALDIQRRLVRLLAATVTNLAREGRFNAAIILTVWTDLKRRLDEDTLRELKEFLPRDVLTKITAPICEKSGDGKCLKRYPHQIALSELKEMKRLVTSKRYAHFSTSSLCLYAKRKELVSCNRDTWYRYINRYGWERPLRNRKFKLVHSGLRATRPDEVWHVDATHIKLSDGTRYFLQVLIDNYSRRVLAWVLGRKLNATTTADLIEQATSIKRSQEVDLITDGGPENDNKLVKKIVASSRPRIVQKIAQVEIPKSNSMVERLFHSLKNRHLYSQRLDTVRDATRNIRFYINQHNDVIPQSVLSGMTPAEAHADGNPEELAAKLNLFAQEKRQLRLDLNRSNVCSQCKFTDDDCEITHAA